MTLTCFGLSNTSPKAHMNVKSFNHYLASGIVTIVHFVPDIEPDVVIYFRGYMLLSNVTSYKTTRHDYILLKIER